jgi:magnesium transporter
MTTAAAPPALRIIVVRGAELRDNVPAAELPALLEDKSAFIWIDAAGSDNPEAEALARDLFHFHKLAIADCFGTREHPKVDLYDDHLFIITHGIAMGSTAAATDVNELDCFLGSRYIFTYHEKPSRSIAGALELVLRNKGGPLRRGPAALLHAILDRQVDSMEALIDDLDDRIQQIEDRILIKPGGADLSKLLALKRTTLHLRRWMTKQREVILRLGRNEFALIPAGDAVHFRDVYDHMYRVTDLIENHREMLGSLHETYLSVTNLRLGEIMKFLTLFTAVLMPLTVITGVYGMNFEFMPELHHRWGYPAALATMFVVAVGVLWFFRRKGWIGK